ncbi:hypothetical protein GQ44DRAFT_709690 [Phaeosphaeriaceae sp. PMI808]|nr:hypothetical protein GQ44DRAFT_709690 [Phaeosphaeriaceae sp. PMI808]
MIAIDTPRSAHKKASLFRRFSRKVSSDQLNSKPANSHNTAVCPPDRLRKRSLDRPNSAPVSSPTESKNDNRIEIRRTPSPHLTKDKLNRKDKPNTLTRCLDLPRVVVHEGQSRTSSSSNSPRISTPRVRANAIPTTPFPPFPQNRTSVATWDIYLPPTQVRSLYLGFLPAEMCDKWFIYSEGPDTMGKLKVHFHRSWTGAKVVELFVVMDVKGGGAGKVVGVKWDAGVDVGNGNMDGQEAKDIVRATVQSVLNVEFEDDH